MGRDKATVPYQGATWSSASSGRRAALRAGVRDRRARDNRCPPRGRGATRRRAGGGAAGGDRAGAARGRGGRRATGLRVRGRHAAARPRVDRRARRPATDAEWCCRGTVATTTWPGCIGPRWPSGSTRWSRPASAACGVGEYRRYPANRDERWPAAHQREFASSILHRFDNRSPPENRTPRVFPSSES